MVPIGLVILVATAAFFGHGLDPDEQFVAQTNLPVGKLSFEVLRVRQVYICLLASFSPMWTVAPTCLLLAASKIFW